MRHLKCIAVTYIPQQRAFKAQKYKVCEKQEFYHRMLTDVEYRGLLGGGTPLVPSNLNMLYI